MKISSLTVLAILTMPWPAWSQGSKPKTLDELAVYSGADRQKILLDGAKAEGKVVWYTSLWGNYREIVDAFKKKYPEIQLKFIAPAVPTWLKGCSTKLALDVIWRTHGDDSRFFDVAQGKWDSQILRFTGAGEVSRRDKNQGGWGARSLGDRP